MATATMTPTGNGLLEQVLEQPPAVPQMPLELLKVRMENETIMAECRLHPRDFGEIKRQLGTLLREFPEFADDAIYAKDVGGGKIAEDLSVRAAEALAEAYGYNRISADVTAVDADSSKVSATFTDYQTGRVWTDAVIVSKWYTSAKSKGARRERYTDDRFNDTVCKATKSKVIREVICRSVNPALKAWFKNECYKIMAETLKSEDVDKIVAGWKAVGVNQKQLEQLIGRPISMGLQQEDRLRLKTFYVAIRDKETTIEALLAGDGQEAPATVDELTAKIQGKEPTTETVAVLDLNEISAGIAACTSPTQVNEYFLRAVAGQADEDTLTIEQWAQERKAELAKKPKKGELLDKGNAPTD